MFLVSRLTIITTVIKPEELSIIDVNGEMQNFSSTDVNMFLIIGWLFYFLSTSICVVIGYLRIRFIWNFQYFSMEEKQNKIQPLDASVNQP